MINGKKLDVGEFWRDKKVKMITAMIWAERIREVERALRDAKVPGFAFYPVEGHCSESAVEGEGRSFIFVDVLPRKKVQVIFPQDMVEDIIKAIREAPRTGDAHRGGIIYATFGRENRQNFHWRKGFRCF